MLTRSQCRFALLVRNVQSGAVPRGACAHVLADITESVLDNFALLFSLMCLCPGSEEIWP